MKTFIRNTVLAKSSPNSSTYIPQNTIFTDIETTGLSAQRDFIYCIGISYMENDSVTILQWFAENRREEPVILQRFLDFLSQNDIQVIWTFNGKTFDLPFMEKRYRIYHLPFDLSPIEHRDLLQEIRPCRPLLSLSRLRQKDLEQFMGIHREDQFDGGQLTEVYLSYEKSQDPELLHLLRLHNYEDMEGMYRILPVLSYRSLTDGQFDIETIFCEEYQDLEGNPGQHLSFQIIYPFCLPRTITYTAEQLHLLLKEEKGIISVPVTAGELKYFLPDYKNYYYLPAEDTAIHRSVGQFVEPSYRVPAGKENCFLKKSGCFFCGNIKDSLFQFQTEYRSRQRYMDISDIWKPGETIDIRSLSIDIQEAFHKQLTYLLSHLKNGT